MECQDPNSYSEIYVPNSPYPLHPILLIQVYHK